MQIKADPASRGQDQGKRESRRQTMNRTGIIALLAIIPLSACVEEAEISPQAAFMDNCAVCHGMDGTGNGPAAAGLDPRPADLTGLSARNGGVFPRNYVMTTIDGYVRGTHFSDQMPIFGDGDLGPTVIVENPDGTGTPVPARLLALTDFLETIQR
jgi:mono/diheme cytochrome c family protein